MYESKIVICKCSSPAHHLIICNNYDLVEKTKEEPELYCYVLLNRIPFLKRLVTGIKYIIFGKTKNYCYDEIILSEKQVKQLIDYFEEYLDKYNNWRLENGQITKRD